MKVAVYGSLREGLGNHEVLNGAPKIAETFTGPEFKMISLGGFPGVLPGDKKVKVEVYQVDDEETKIGLDRLEGYPDFYDRKEVKLENGDKAWIYILNERYKELDKKEHITDWKEFLTKTERFF